MVSRFLVVLPVLSLRLLSAGEGPVPDLAPPGTRVVIGFHVRTVMESTLARRLSTGLVQSVGATFTSSSSLPGINPLKDLDEVVIASTMEGDHPTALVICRGRFPVAEGEKTAERYHGVPIRVVPKGGVLALLDRETVLAGDSKQVRAAIDRRNAHTSGLNPGLARRAAELSGRYAIWGTGTVPKTYRPPAGGPDGLASLHEFDFGIALDHGLELAATLHLDDPKDTKKLATAMALVEALTKAQPDASGTKIETKVDSSTLTVSLLVSEEALEKAIVQQQANIGQALAKAVAGGAVRFSGGSPGANPRVTVTAPPAMPPAPKETKIVSDEKGNSLLVTLPGR